MNDISKAKTLEDMDIDALCVNTIRTLAMDAVQAANSGHPGTPMALAPAAYALWSRFLKHNPRDPQWFDRDRFVLSNGHASMLLYAMLHLTGYDLSLDDIKRFRQWGSKTPGHPEYRHTPGVETTTGPLGQGIMTAVGMAIAEAHLAAVFNRAGHRIVDHYTYVFASDGDMMEGASHEAASLAGHLGLGKLIVLFDDNRITIEGGTALAFSDDTERRFEGYHWHVQNLGDKGTDIEAITRAFRAARAETARPSLIILRTHIAEGAPNAQDTPEAHGAALGEEEVKLTKEAYGWPHEERFLVPARAAAHMGEAVRRGEDLENEWRQALARYREAHPDLAAQFEASLRGDLPADWHETLPRFAAGEALATRSASGKVINRIAGKLPWLMGGSGDLAPSTNTIIKESGDLEKNAYANRNLHWGVREHLMVAASSGIALHGGLRPYAATFFIFTDYARPAIRLAAMMGLPVIYVMTHDSVGLGEDGPTHQPIEHLASFRAMPNMCLIRPGDANETAFAWRAALERRDGPTMLVLTRQKLPVFDRARLAGAEGAIKGAYVLSKEEGELPQVVLIASGSEVQLILAAKDKLAQENIAARAVSMPSWELFRIQPQAYRDAVLPPTVKARVAVEAGATLGWCEWVGEAGRVIGINRFGASAPYKENFAHFGFTVDHVVETAKDCLGGWTRITNLGE